MIVVDKPPINTAVPSYYSTNDIGGKVQTVSDANIIKILNQFTLVPREGISGMFRDIWRSFTWSMITGTAWIADGVSMLSTGLLTFLNFYMYQPVVDFLQEFQVYIVLASILFFGIAWIAAMSKKEIPIVDMLKNGAFALFTYLVLPLLMMVGVGFVQSVSQVISTHNTPSAAIIKDNVYDIRAIDKANWDLTTVNKVREAGNGAPNFIDEYADKNGDLTVQNSELKYIDPTERMENKDEKQLSDFGQKVVSQKLHYSVSKSGNFKKVWELVPLENNMVKEDGHYYTYSWNWWTIELSLWAIIIFTVILLIRMARIEVEIFMNWVIGNVISLSQWGTSKRNWEIISKIGMGFTTLIFTQSLSVLFTFGLLQLNDLLQSGKINFIMYLILLFAFGMEMIDGPALWQQFFSIDAGIKSGWQSAWGGLMLVKQMNDLFNPFSAQRRMQRAMSKNAKSNKQSSNDFAQPEQRNDANQGGPTPPNAQSSESPENNQNQGKTQNENKTSENNGGEGKTDTPEENKNQDSQGSPGSESNSPTSGKTETQTPESESKTPETPASSNPEGESEPTGGTGHSEEPQRPEARKDLAPQNPFGDPADDYWMNDGNLSEEPSQPEYQAPWEGF